MTRLLLISALFAWAAPLSASEPEKPQPSDQPSQPQAQPAPEAKSPPEESPIPRLVEFKLDEHIVPARMINIKGKIQAD